MTYNLLDLTAAFRTIGRAVVFYAPVWTGAVDLTLTHLGDTEGDVTMNPNESFDHLTVPELSGSAKLKTYLTGADPTVEIPLWLADPALRAILTPGGAHGGYTRRQAVVERTIVLFPEELFLIAGVPKALAYTTGGGWTLNAVALDAEHLRLLALSIWLWRGYFTTTPFTFKHGDAGKLVDKATFQCQQSSLSTISEGHKLYTIGDPASASPAILIDVT